VSIDPRTAMIIKIVIAILTAITTGTLSLTGLVSAATATQIVALASVGTVVLGIVMSAYSSSQPGPAAPPDPKAVVAATKLVTANSTAEVNAAKTELNMEIAKH
jgi:hypothetical protein